jgi:hypothetical protein
MAKTTAAILAVSAVSLAVSLPVVQVLARMVQGGSAVVILGQGRIPGSLWWLATLVAVLITFMVKLGWGWRSGGFLAGLFVVEALTWETTALAVFFAAVTYLFVKALASVMVLTPRQRFQASLVFGSLFAWFGLYWFTQLNFVPAIVANGYPIAPLLIVGLLASDFGRKSQSIPFVLAGLGLVVAAVTVAVYVAKSIDFGSWIVIGVVAVVFVGWNVVERQRFKRSLDPALAVGKLFADRVPRLARFASPGETQPQ